MVKHMLFLRWWLMIAVIAVAGYFCYTFGIFHEILDKDMTYISVGIGVAFTIMSLWCGMKTFRLSRAINREETVFHIVR